MPEWAEDSMREAIETLARMGRNDLASDLGRIAAKIDFDDLEVLRCPGTDRIADAILEADSFAGLASLLGRIAAAMSFQHCTLHVVSEAATTNFSTKVITTYPSAWVSRYVDRRYHSIDPVMRACTTSIHGFHWHRLSRSSPVAESFWRDFTAHGLGSTGYTQPIVTERGDKLALSVCSLMEPDRFESVIARYESDLVSLCIFLSDAFCTLASEMRPTSFNPSDDQLTILRALALGADEAELSARTYQFGSYATLARSICELFRTRTVTAAAILAGRIGILSEAPLGKADILEACGDAIEAAEIGTPLRRLARARNLAEAIPPGE